MKDLDHHSAILERLKAPPKRSGNPSSATSLVREHYDAVRAAWMKDRQIGKTWAEIGADLRPADPILGGTVGRAFARVTAERSRNEGGRAGGALVQRAGRDVARRVESDQESAARATRPNPFARTIDPIRVASAQGADDE